MSICFICLEFFLDFLWDVFIHCLAPTVRPLSDCLLCFYADRPLGEEACFAMQRLVCASVFRQTAVLLQICPPSCSRTTQRLYPPTQQCWKHPRWLSSSSVLCSPASQKNTSSDHLVNSAPVQDDPDPLQDKSIGLIQRFKKTFKQYGKVMIPVHLLTSTMWFGTFYYAAMK